MMRGGDQRMLRGTNVGHHERSGAATFLKPTGVKRGTNIARLLEHVRWYREFSATCTRVPWQLRSEQRKCLRLSDVSLLVHVSSDWAGVLVGRESTTFDCHTRQTLMALYNALIRMAWEFSHMTKIE